MSELCATGGDGCNATADDSPKLSTTSPPSASNPVPSVSPPPALNSSSYLFTPLPPDALPSLREALLAHLLSHGPLLRGTILLAPEGINVQLSGAPAAIHAAHAFLTSVPSLAGLVFKLSPSARITLRRSLVKIKAQIIPLGGGARAVAPDARRAVAPATFKNWLDHDDTMLVLDARNDYEVRLGRFAGAEDMSTRNFRAFPDAARARLRGVDRATRIVMYCTGGVRCEKGAAVLAEEGFGDVWQLDGGILKYFEDVGAEHFRGECYVFDGRVSVAPDLREGTAEMCFRCGSPLRDGESVVDGQCVYCVEGKPGRGVGGASGGKSVDADAIAEESLVKAVDPEESSDMVSDAEESIGKFADSEEIIDKTSSSVGSRE